MRRYDKGDYKHFMAKEIEEQPTTLKNGINEYVDTLNNDINIYNFPWKTNEISSVTLNWLWNSLSFLFTRKILV